MAQKVTFNIASEASYVYILRGQKFIKNAHFEEFLKTWSLLSNSVTRQVNFIWTKMDKKNSNWDILCNFQTLWFCKTRILCTISKYLWKRLLKIALQSCLDCWNDINAR